MITQSNTGNHSTNSSVMNLNKITLSFFDKGYENYFRREYFNNSLKLFRISFLVVIALYSLFGYLDKAISEPFFERFFFIRYYIVIPLLSIVLIFSYHRYFIKVWQGLLSISFVVGGSGIIYMLLLEPNNMYYYGGMFLIFIAGHFFIKLRFFYAVISGFLLIVIFNIGTIFFPVSPTSHYNYLLVINIFYISANIISLLALHNIEYLTRKDFNQKVLLSKKQQEIEKINQNLEVQVKERTKLLDQQNKNLLEEIISRKKIEKQLVVAKNQAEEADNLKSSFLANMSHEIRTPMNSIIGFTGLLNDDDISIEEIQEYSEIIARGGTRMINTIDDLVNISEIEAGQVELTNSRVNIQELFNETYSLHKTEAEDKKLQFILDSNSSNEEYFIRTDDSKYKAILSILIKNAIKFTKTGKIEIGYKIKYSVSLDSKTNRSEEIKQLNCYIKDTGIGIPDNRQKAIFERFIQADMALSSSYEGSGLGLSIAKAYVEMLNGIIWLESEVDKGTVFYFSIPDDAIGTYENKYFSFNNNLGKTKKLKILVADDEKFVHTYLSGVLKPVCKEILYAEDGLTAIDICKENKDIDMIFMDHNMPRMKGLDATKYIREFNKEVIIVLQTAYVLKNTREKALIAGCNDYITKPLLKNRVIKLINKWL